MQATLNQVAPGAKAVILALRCGNCRQRLAERGLMPGVEIRVLRNGKPMMVALEDARWGIDAHEAREIDVLVDESALLKPRGLRALFRGTQPERGRESLAPAVS